MTTDELIRERDAARANTMNGYGPARTAAYRMEVHRLEGVIAERVRELEGRLTEGEQWFRDHPGDDRTRRYEDAWLDLLSQYETAYDAVNG